MSDARREDAAGERLPEPFTSPAFWICPVCACGAAERVESCEGYVDIADPEEGETEDTDARHEVVYRPEYVHRLLAALSTAERERDVPEGAENVCCICYHEMVDTGQLAQAAADLVKFANQMACTNPDTCLRNAAYLREIASTLKPAARVPSGGET